jgi:hypothetical protein
MGHQERARHELKQKTRILIVSDAGFWTSLYYLKHTNGAEAGIKIYQKTVINQ